MRTVVLIFAMMLLCLASYSQTYKSPCLLKQKVDIETDMTERTITLSDKEITVTNFLDGGTKLWRLTINKIENKEWMFDGMQKTYYCTDKDKDIISGTYRKAIVYRTKTAGIKIASFADEITVLVYNFGVE